MRGDFLVVLDRLLPLMGRDGATFLTRVNSTPSPPDYKAVLEGHENTAKAGTPNLVPFSKSRS